MGDPLIITMLSSKRAEISGQIVELETAIRARKVDLSHLDATLRLFDPTIVPATIQAKRPSRTSEFFAQGELTGFIMDTIRTTGRSVTSRELTDGLIARKEMDADDKLLRITIQKRVRAALSAARRRGVLVAIGEGWDTRWQIADMPG